MHWLFYRHSGGFARAPLLFWENQENINAVLEGRPDGADHFKILDLIKEKYEKEVPRASLSPQLSRLKNDDGVLELLGSNWVLIDKKEEKKEEAPEGASVEDLF